MTVKNCGGKRVYKGRERGSTSCSGVVCESERAKRCWQDGQVVAAAASREGVGQRCKQAEYLRTHKNDVAL